MIANGYHRIRSVRNFPSLRLPGHLGHMIAQRPACLLPRSLFIQMKRLAELDRDGRATKEPISPIIGGAGAMYHHRQHGHLGPPGDHGGPFFEFTTPMEGRFFADPNATFGKNHHAVTGAQMTHGIAHRAGVAALAIDGKTPPAVHEAAKKPVLKKLAHRHPIHGSGEKHPQNGRIELTDVIAHDQQPASTRDTIAPAQANPKRESQERRRDQFGDTIEKPKSDLTHAHGVPRVASGGPPVQAWAWPVA